MGLMRWMRGGDDNSSTAAAISAGLAEIDGLFRPSKHKQTEHIAETKRRRLDVSNGAGVDLDTGVARVQARPTEADPEVAAPARRVREKLVYQPRRKSWWERYKMARYRRRKARAARTEAASATR